MTTLHTVTFYRSKAKLFQQSKCKQHVAFTVTTPTALTSATMASVKKFLRAIHLCKDDLNTMHRSLSLYIDAHKIPFDNKHNVVEQRLANGIVFYTYKYFQDHDGQQIKPYDIYYVNGNMDIRVLTNMIQAFAPNLFLRRPHEQAKSVSDNLGYQVSVRRQA
ncbi:hypothetical protein GGF32_002701 [Allomyces javanicus]|nr:hypothetical protein GGF32_002701 [Allomyces javanicus]